MNVRSNMAMMAFSLAALVFAACGSNRTVKTSSSAVMDARQGVNAPAVSDYVLIVTVKVKADRIADFKQALLAIVAPTRAQDGNLAYHVHQSPTDPSLFAVYEHWDSDAAHAAHMASAVMVSYASIVAPMVESGYPVRAKYIELNELTQEQ